MKTWIGRLLCAIGLHDWDLKEGQLTLNGRPVRECTRCSKLLWWDSDDLRMERGKEHSMAERRYREYLKKGDSGRLREISSTLKEIAERV